MVWVYGTSGVNDHLASDAVVERRREWESQGWETLGIARWEGKTRLWFRRPLNLEERAA